MAAPQRELFPGLERKTYLNTCSLGLLGAPVRRAIERHLDQWETDGASAWYGPWLDEIDSLRRRVARLLNASPHEVAILPNVSTALGVVASALSGDRRRVVTTDLDFPTIPYQWRARPGWEVTTVAANGSGVADDQWDAHMGDDVAAVATSHVFFTTGFVQDVGHVVDVAHDHDALAIIDSYQGAGQVPVDVKALDVDVLITGGLKWLLGGTGVAYLYVREDLHDTLSPSFTGWFAHRDQFAFDPHTFTPHDDARRFETGTPSLPSVHAGGAGLDLLFDVGPERVQERTRGLVDHLVTRLHEEGFALGCPEEPGRRSAIVPVLHDDAADVVAALAARDVVVDARPGRVRVSPYYYNTREDVDVFVDALVEVSAKG